MSIGIIACGALALEIEGIQRLYDLDVVIYPLPPLLHNSPKQIPSAVDDLLHKIKSDHEKCAVAYADCGTYGALDEIISSHGVMRMAGSHCYDVFVGKHRFDEIMDHAPVTYFLTDFLVKSFHRSVIVELGLDLHPDLRDDYFQYYSKVMWLAQNPAPELQTLAEECAEKIGLPLEVQIVGTYGLAKEILNFVQS
jgi:hypothetical protein